MNKIYTIFLVFFCLLNMTLSQDINSNPENSEVSSEEPEQLSEENELSVEPAEPDEPAELAEPPQPPPTVESNEAAIVGLQNEILILQTQLKTVNNEMGLMTKQAQTSAKTNFARIRLEVQSKKLTGAPPQCVKQAESSLKLQEKSVHFNSAMCKKFGIIGVSGLREEVKMLNAKVDTLGQQNNQITTNCSTLLTPEDQSICQQTSANEVALAVSDLQQQTETTKQRVTDESANIIATQQECLDNNIANSDPASNNVVQDLNQCITASQASAVPAA